MHPSEQLLVLRDNLAWVVCDHNLVFERDLQPLRRRSCSLVGSLLLSHSALFQPHRCTRTNSPANIAAEITGCNTWGAARQLRIRRHASITC